MATKAPPESEQLLRKERVVAEIRERLEAADAAVLTEYRGLTVGQIADLRAALRAADTEYKVFKNTLARRAARDSGNDELLDFLDGPVGIAFVAGDAVPAAKALESFAANVEAFVVKGGMLGDRLLTAGEIAELSKVAPREELLAQLAGGFKAPMARAAGALSGLQRKLAYAVSAYVDKRTAAGESAEEPAASGAAGADTEPSEPVDETAEASSDGGSEPATRESKSEAASETTESAADGGAASAESDDVGESAEDTA